MLDLRCLRHVTFISKTPQVWMVWVVWHDCIRPISSRNPSDWVQVQVQGFRLPSRPFSDTVLEPRKKSCASIRLSHQSLKQVSFAGCRKYTGPMWDPSLKMCPSGPGVTHLRVDLSVVRVPSFLYTATILNRCLSDLSSHATLWRMQSGMNRRSSAPVSGWPSTRFSSTSLAGSEHLAHLARSSHRHLQVSKTIIQHMVNRRQYTPRAHLVGRTKD
jgi:hypothetical protein